MLRSGGNTARPFQLRSGGGNYQPRLAVEDDAEDEKEEEEVGDS